MFSANRDRDGAGFRLPDKADAASLSGNAEIGHAALAVQQTGRAAFEAAAREGEAPVPVTCAAIRPFVRGIVERFRAQAPVLSRGRDPPAR